MPRPRPTHEKKCSACQTVKPREDFYESKKYDGGLSPYCRDCTAVKNKQHRNAAKVREYMKKRYAENAAVREKVKAHAKASKARAQTQPAKYRAKKFFDVAREGIAPDVTREYLEELFQQTTHCQCCGKELSLAYEPRESRHFRSNPNAPSVDRVNNKKGYTRDNIAIICWQCNFRKTDLTLEDLKMFENYIRRFGDV